MNQSNILSNQDSNPVSNSNPNNNNNNNNGTNNNNNDDRDKEKHETISKLRENYLNINIDNLDNESIIYNTKISIIEKIKLLFKKLTSNIDKRTEILFYLFSIEMFFIFLTYTHYSYFDKKNRFLTPIVMGGETSLLGQTLSQLFKWVIFCSNNNTSNPYIIQDEEMNICNSEISNISDSNEKKQVKDFNDTFNKSSTSNGTYINNKPHFNNMHIRNSSKNNIQNITIPINNNNNNDNKATNIVDQDITIQGHLKFFIWGGVNGLLCSYWIELLLSIFKGKKIVCVLIDQSIGSVIFQTLYSLFICLWDGEIEIDGTLEEDINNIINNTININSNHYNNNLNKTVDLTWDNFKKYYSGMLWKYMKLSYLIWPFISVLCFTILKDEWIFPVNCFFTTLFSVILGM